MGYFQVRYDSRVVNYDRRGFIILATDLVQLFFIIFMSESFCCESNVIVSKLSTKIVIKYEWDHSFTKIL